MTRAVLDAGPLIHLAELESLDILSDFQILYVADTVWQEAEQHRPQIFSHHNLCLERISVPTPSPELHALAQGLALDQGEIESLGLMEQYPHAFFLTDDAAARLAAEQRGYRVHGTIGLLIRSVRRNQKPADEILELLRALPQRSTLFIRPNLLESIIKQLEKEWTIK